MTAIASDVKQAIDRAPGGDKFKTNFRNPAEDASTRIVWAGLKTALGYLREHDGANVLNAVKGWVNLPANPAQADLLRATDTALEYLNYLRYAAKQVEKPAHFGAVETPQAIHWPAPAINDAAHPGLLLDKYTAPGNQEHQKTALQKVCQKTVDPDLYRAVKTNRDAMLTSLGAKTWNCRTVTPLTLHLARSAALENAGICLHPIHGFVYLPGSGLKGMARAFATSVWLPTQEDQETARGQILEVFGNERNEKEDFKAGCIVFHDAWPESPPTPHVDIVNNHHTDYYNGKGEEFPPGDWESPTMVYFLAIGPGVKFSFALSRLWADTAREQDDPLALAQQWLTGALVHLGAGAKTAAGYGAFVPDENVPVLGVGEKRKTFRATIELVTPAFLAGANQESADSCDLRSATLRGQLRWWWRTMHAAHLSVGELRALEAKIWGSAEVPSPLQVRILSFEGENVATYLADYKEASFLPLHGIEENRAAKTVQGLYYAAFGMDEMHKDKETGQKSRKRRHYIYPGAKWALEIEAKDSNHIAKEVAYEEALCALWLLCRYGGVGSRCRKGFGSLQLTEALDLDLDKVKQRSAKTREILHCASAPATAFGGSPRLESLTDCESPLPWTNPWYTLDHVGGVLQAFAKIWKRNTDKVVLGLPRKVGHVPQEHGSNTRFSSPVHHHVFKLATGELGLRVAALPAKPIPAVQPPSDKTIAHVLDEYLAHVKSSIAHRTTQNQNEGKRPCRPLGGGSRSSTGAATFQIASSTLVEVVILDEKTKKGGPVAAIIGNEKIKGAILKWEELSEAERQPGTRLRLLTTTDNVLNMQFKIPPSDDGKKTNQPKGKKPALKDRHRR